MTGGPLDSDLVGDLLLEAMELASTERVAFLEERCADAPTLRAEVESLLASLEAPGLVPDLEEDEPFGGRYPDRMGDYRIVRPLGEGGMGVVLLAIREGEGFEQTVALKLIRGSFVDPLLVRRLEEERRILALLEHPGIARLVDGGVTAEGQPYYAMEYVRGEQILDYCDARRLGIEDRIRLFIQVCEAVHHAHQQLIVHRDLKPSNIFVTPEGRPKLLDFGIAKNLESLQAGEQTAPWVTPAYASPEQVSGGIVSTLSDVYALGVLLCEILAGAKPYETSGSSPAEIMRAIGEVRPTRPSELVERGADPNSASSASPETAAHNRRSTPGRLAKLLRGELDLVVLKSLAKEPARRYDSAWALKEDLQRYLDGRPLHARPDSVGYRVRKMVGRHKVLVGVSAALLLAVIGGVVGILWQAGQAAAERERAEAAAVRARQVTAMMTEIFRLADPTQAVGDTIGVRQVLEEGARRVDEALDADPILQATLFLELGRVYRNLGILGEAGSLGERALALRAANLPGTVEHAEVLGFQAAVSRDAGDRPRAVAMFEEAIRLREALDPTPDTALATLMSQLAWEVRSDGEYDRAGDLFSRALDIQRRQLGEEHPTVGTTMLGLAATYHDRGRFDDAVGLFEGALERERTEADPVAATALVNLGMIQRLREQFREAEPALRAGLAMREALYDPTHLEVVEARQQLGVTLSGLGRYDEARRLIARNLEVALELFGEDHQATRNALEALGLIELRTGHYTAAFTLLERSKDAKVRAHGGDHPGIVFSFTLLGDARLLSGDPGQAEAFYRDAIAMRDRLGSGAGVFGGLAGHGLARAALARGDLTRAEALLDEAVTEGFASLRQGHRYLLEAGRTRARILMATGAAAEAEVLLEEIVAGERATRPEVHPRVAATLALTGDARALQGDRAGARDAWRAALEAYAGVPDDHPEVVRLRSALAGAG